MNTYIYMIGSARTIVIGGAIIVERYRCLCCLFVSISLFSRSIINTSSYLPIMFILVYLFSGPILPYPVLSSPVRPLY